MTSSVMTPTDLIPFLRAHDCFRRDLGRIRLLLSDPRPLSAPRAAALAGYWAHFTALLEHHHQAEDDNILPVLVDRVPAAAGPVAVLEREHVDLQRLLDESMPLFAALAEAPADTAALARCVGALEQVVDQHLEAEEREVVPLFVDCFSRSQWMALEQMTTDALVRDGLLPFALPWAAEDLDPDIMAAALELLPEPVRAAYHEEWLARYTRQVQLIWIDRAER